MANIAFLKFGLQPSWKLRQTLCVCVWWVFLFSVPLCSNIFLKLAFTGIMLQPFFTDYNQLFSNAKNYLVVSLESKLLISRTKVLIYIFFKWENATIQLYLFTYVDFISLYSRGTNSKGMLSSQTYEQDSLTILVCS